MFLPTRILRALGFTSFLVSITTAQSCTNYGISSASGGCLCPPGFGGANCSQPACGGTIFDGSDRTLTPSSVASGGFPNLTSSGCSCTGGWTGEGCNVCTTASACQTAYAAVSGNSSSSAATSQTSGLNETMVCNTSPVVWAAGELSCQVNVCALMRRGRWFDRFLSRTRHCKRSTLCNPHSTFSGPLTPHSLHCKMFLAWSCPPTGLQRYTHSCSTAASNSSSAPRRLVLKHPRAPRILGLVPP